MNILFFDLETTGLDADRHGIIEIAAQLYSGTELVDTFNAAVDIHCLLESGKVVALDALKVNGVTFYNQEKVCVERNIKSIFKSERAAMQAFADWLVGATLKVDGKLYVAGQNVAFDLGFIKTALKNNGIEGWDRAVSYRTIDTSDISRFLVDSGVLHIPLDAPRGGGLQRVALGLGIEVRDRKLHTALEDVKLTAEVYFAMKKRLEDLANGRKTT